MADDQNGLKVVDISDPTNPSLTDSYDTPGAVCWVALAGDNVYLADGTTGLLVIEISEPKYPTWGGSYFTPGLSNYITVSGDYAYVADGSSGLKVLDVSSPPAITYAGGYNTPDDAMGVAISGDYAYVADYSSGLQVIDISDPTAPSYAGSYDTPGYALRVAIDGDYAFIADGSSLQVIDISDPTSPSFTGGCATPGFAWGVAIAGDYAYVADWEAGLTVIDISNLAAPSVAGTRDTPGGARGIAVDGDYGFVADYDSGLQVIDISIPTAPVIVGSYDTPGNAWGVTIAGNYALVSDGSAGIQVMDISNPTSPSLASSYDSPGAARNVALSGIYAPIADYNEKVRSVQVFQRSYDAENNQGQSIVFSSPGETIAAVKLSSTQVDSISWEISADNGINWQEIPSNNGWYPLDVPGNEPLWRSSHYVIDSNPACSNLQIEWLYNFSEIDSIVDVPDDQGGWVRVYFTRSGRDFEDEGTYPITGYYLFRRIDDTSFRKRILVHGESPEEQHNMVSTSGGKVLTVPKSISGSRVIYLDGRYFLISKASKSDGLPLGTWEVVGSVPAHQEDQYVCLVPTLADSSSTLICSVYCISAETTTPSVYYFSPPDSGYSVDNLEPSTPQGLMAASGDTSINLAWNVIPDEDFRYYAIYRGTESGFTPDTSNLLGTTIDTAYIDIEVLSDSTYYYRVSAYDFAGNESERSDEASCQFVGIYSYRDMELPKSFSLSQNYPNPFNPVTEIRYALPNDCYIRLEVYNTLGQKVTSLVGGKQKAGYKIVKWDASSFSSGIYFCRLQAGEFVQTRKMILLK